MMITKTKLYYILLVLCVLCQNRFFHIVNASVTLTTGLILDIILLLLIALADKYNAVCKYQYKYLIALTIIVIIPQTIYASALGETLGGYIDVIRGILNIFLVVPLLKFFYRKKGMDEGLNMVTFLTSITLGLILINSFLINNFDSQLLPFSYFEKPATARGDWIRIYLISDFTGFVSIYSFCKMLEKRTRNIWYLVPFVICLGASVYVEQSRMQYMAIIASCIVAYTQTLKEGKPYFYITAIIVTVVGILGDWFSSFFEMFSVTNEGLGISTLIRINEYIYALELFFKHPILGTGMVSNYLFEVERELFIFEYNHTDIGLIGCITYIGLIGTLVLFIIPYIRFIKTLKMFSNKETGSFEYCFLLGLVVFISITSLTTLMTDNSRIFAWPFVLAVFEFERYQLVRRREETNEF